MEKICIEESLLLVLSFTILHSISITIVLLALNTMPLDQTLAREEVFRCFWLMCVAIADLVYMYNRAHPDEYRCEWRRHSLVIVCSHQNNCEISVQRRKDLAFCVANPGRFSIWEGRIAMISSGHAGIVHRGSALTAASAAGVLFQSIVSHAHQSKAEIAKAAGHN